MGTRRSLKQRSILNTRRESDARGRTLKTVSEITDRFIDQALGQLTKKVKDPDTGEVTHVPCEMTDMEYKAGVVIMNKAMPDRKMVEVVEHDPVDNMSREDISITLTAILQDNPQLAEMAGIVKAVNEIKTVAEIVPINDKD